MTGKHFRIVIDTNVFVSAILRRDSTAGRAVRSAISTHIVLTSTAVFIELAEVLQRPKFERSRTLAARQEALDAFQAALEPIRIDSFVSDCRDESDNKFLELALCGNADLLLSGDRDLLALHPWRGVEILSPADYLARFR